MELHKPNMNPQSLSSRQKFKNIRTKATGFQQKHLSSYTRKPNSNKPDTLMQKLVWTEVHKNQTVIGIQEHIVNGKQQFTTLCPGHT